jgi:hypothetical protein
MRRHARCPIVDLGTFDKEESVVRDGTSELQLEVRIAVAASISNRLDIFGA